MLELDPPTTNLIVKQEWRSEAQQAPSSCLPKPTYEGKLFRGHAWRFGSCAVVGSSGARTSRDYGAEIDAHDTVKNFDLINVNILSLKPPSICLR